ncbi:unnamed protein product [Rotaria sordida]|uniref:Uncharacterized protein n=1 Tax=Rotaria sordida TaxID=392033 RepID=A0A814S4S2_9BILA|nr:unnamed protein product [Rotaria sordida]CAF1142615.1 unnamed protein product [Rotaria sordida]
MVLQLTLSCDLNNSQSGPTLIHSTGVQHYKIPPDVIRILQENISNDLLSDHQEGVLCQEGPQRVLDVLRRNGFNIQKQTTDHHKALWTVVQSGGSSHGGGGHQPVPPPPHPTPTGENDEDAGREEQGGDENNEGEGEGGEGEGGEGEGEEGEGEGGEEEEAENEKKN